jgi:hypothetical protein
MLFIVAINGMGKKDRMNEARFTEKYWLSALIIF